MTTIKPDVPPGRLRRIVSHPASLLVIGVVLVALVMVISANVARPFKIQEDSPWRFVAGTLMALAVIGSYKGYKLWIERAPDKELEANGFVLELLCGIVTGAALFSAVVGIVALLGGLEITAIAGPGDLWGVLGLSVMSAVFEEVLFRGIIMRHLEPMLGTIGALLLTSAFFGGAHLGNPDATLFAALAIAIEAGILLGAAYLLTRRLWLAIGIHGAWNFTQGWVFSAPVSGGKAPEGLFVTSRAGPDWLTGGSFGLEASVIALVVATAAGLVMLWFAARKGEIVSPRWWKGGSSKGEAI
jgi:membrane protease YdiL (CAAX protease family)